MLLTLERLHELTRALEQARRDNGTPGSPLFCPAERLGEDGKNFRTEARRKRDGTTEELTLPLGPHGRAFLAVDPKSGKVRCGACEGR